MEIINETENTIAFIRTPYITFFLPSNQYVRLRYTGTTCIGELNINGGIIISIGAGPMLTVIKTFASSAITNICNHNK